MDNKLPESPESEEYRRPSLVARAGGRAQRLRTIPVRRLVPNALTLLALCAGLTSVRLGLEGRFETAVAALMLAAILDALDGGIARLLRGTSRFGAELDSLVDFVNFGVVPVFLLYLWGLNDLGAFGWIAVLIYSICGALRLARFNTMLEGPPVPLWQRNFFVGVPAPGGAGLVLVPLYISFLTDTANDPVPFAVPLFVGFYVVAIGLLMVSRWPSFSLKHVAVQIPREYALPALVLVAALGAFLLNYPWATTLAIAAVYAASLPISLWRYRVLSKRYAVTSIEEA